MSEEKVKEEPGTKKDNRQRLIYAIVAIVIPFGILLAGITIFVRYMKGKKLLAQKGKEEIKEK